MRVHGALQLVDQLLVVADIQVGRLTHAVSFLGAPISNESGRCPNASKRDKRETCKRCVGYHSVDRHGLWQAGLRHWQTWQGGLLVVWCKQGGLLVGESDMSAPPAPEPSSRASASVAPSPM